MIDDANCIRLGFDKFRNVLRWNNNVIYLYIAIIEIGRKDQIILNVKVKY